MRKQCALAVLLLALQSVVAHAEPSRLHPKVIDLSHTLDADIPTFPGGVPFHAENVSTYEQGYYANKIVLGEHTGTHVDAPLHVKAGGTPIDEIPVEGLVLPGIVIDATVQVSGHDDFVLRPSDVAEWEKTNGKIPSGAAVLLYTGWSNRWFEPVRYLNQDEARVLHFPGFSPEAVTLLADRGVSALGIDTLSIDPGSSKDLAAHHIAADRGLILMENLTDLVDLPPKKFQVIMAPLKIKGGGGSPARILALLS